MLDETISPDGKQLAAVVQTKSGTNLLVTKADDTLLADAKELNVRACKAIWRPDGLELVVVRADDCGSRTRASSCGCRSRIRRPRRRSG